MGAMFNLLMQIGHWAELLLCVLIIYKEKSTDATDGFFLSVMLETKVRPWQSDVTPLRKHRHGAFPALMWQQAIFTTKYSGDTICHFFNK